MEPSSAVDTPPGVMTVTGTVPSPPGAWATHEDSVQDTPVAEASPNRTNPSARWDPTTVTAVPPVPGPPDVLMPVTSGSGGVSAGGCGVLTASVATLSEGSVSPWLA